MDAHISSTPLRQVIPLELLAAGESGRIQELEGSHELVVRLREMGFRQGACIRMVQPGSPCIVAVDHQRISFRGEEAAVVLVEVDSNEPTSRLIP